MPASPDAWRRLPLKPLLLACAGWQLAMPAAALIVVSGSVSPSIPASGAVVGALAVGGSSAGSVRVDGGSKASSDALWLGGNSPTGDGTVLVTGAGSSFAVSATTTGNLDVGGWGQGSLTVSAGATMSYGLPTTTCANNCTVYVSNGAGSRGRLAVSGAGSTFSTPGRVVVGNASVLTLATDALDYGVPGASSSATGLVTAGAVVNSSSLVVANAGGGLGRLGSETSTATLIVDGPGSAWNVLRVAGQTATSTVLDLALGKNTTGTVSILNGGRITLDTSAQPDQANGVRVGFGFDSSSNARATFNVDGAGSRLEINGGGAFFNVGSTTGSTGTVTVSNGGVVTGFGSLGLVFGSVGRNGGSGTVTVTGQDAAGNASRISYGGASQTGGGAFVSIGRRDNVADSNGLVSVLAGGRFEIDTRGVVLANSAALSGAYVGFGAGGTGTLTVGGLGAVNGAASSFAVLGGTGLAPYVAIGRDGGTGNVMVSGGGLFVIDSAHASDPSATTNASGNSVVLDIGRNTTGAALASVGSLTVRGSGSSLALTGSADRYLQVDVGNGGTGTLNVLDGASLQTLYVIAGNGVGAAGRLNLRAATLTLSGVGTSAGLKGLGGTLVVGNSGGTAAASIADGSSLTVAGSAGAVASMVVGGSRNGPGGTGSVSVSGGSSLLLTGPDAQLRVGRNGVAGNAGLGTLDIVGSGSNVQVLGDASTLSGGIVLGTTAFTSGTVNVGAGAKLATDSFIGVAYLGNASTGGSGRLIVDGTVAAPSIYVGTGGYLGGSGVISGKLYNRGGIINPGNSPGTLRIDGGFDNAQGQLILEVQRQADGSYATDQLILGDSSDIVFGSGAIAFRFLGDTDPTAFRNAGLFTLQTFFKEVDGSGNVTDLPASAQASFAGAQFDAQAEGYTIRGFSFSPATGASFTAAAVPQPSAAWLMAGGLLALSFKCRRALRMKR